MKYNSIYFKQIYVMWIRKQGNCWKLLGGVYFHFSWRIHYALTHRIATWYQAASELDASSHEISKQSIFKSVIYMLWEESMAIFCWLDSQSLYSPCTSDRHFCLYQFYNFQNKTFCLFRNSRIEILIRILIY